MCQIEIIKKAEPQPVSFCQEGLMNSFLWSNWPMMLVFWVGSPNGSITFTLSLCSSGVDLGLVLFQFFLLFFYFKGKDFPQVSCYLKPASILNSFNKTNHLSCPQTNLSPLPRENHCFLFILFYGAFPFHSLVLYICRPTYTIQKYFFLWDF